MTHFLYVCVRLFTIGSPANGRDSCKRTHSFNHFYYEKLYYNITQNDAMFFIVSIVSLVFLHVHEVSTECESNATLWTYYPCSFIISATSCNCPYISVNSSIDQCANREMTFFWHFPLGNMTLTLRSHKNQPFLLRLSTRLLSKNKLIKHVYHVNNKSLEERLSNNDKNAMIVLYSDETNQCSMKFQTDNMNIFDYGTFIQMTVLTDERNSV